MVKDIYVQVKAAMKEGGATREFYLNDIVTHILSDAPIDPNTVSLLDCHVLHVSVHTHACYYVNHYFFLQPDWALLSLKCGAQLPYPTIQYNYMITCITECIGADIFSLIPIQYDAL